MGLRSTPLEHQEGGWMRSQFEGWSTTQSGGPLSCDGPPFSARLQESWVRYKEGAMPHDHSSFLPSRSWLPCTVSNEHEDRSTTRC